MNEAEKSLVKLLGINTVTDFVRPTRTLFRKVYFNVWDLKLEILTCFDTILCLLHGVSFM